MVSLQPDVRPRES